MSSLYKIHEDIERIIETGLVIDPETGEITEADATACLAELQLAEEEKLENVALFTKNLSADVEALKAEEKALAERRKAKEKKVSWAKRYLSDFMELTHRKKFESTRCALSFRTSTSLNIADETALREYAKLDDAILRYKEPEIDKKAVTDRIKSGVIIPGAELVSGMNLQIK